jgi:hypothetical protein
MCIKGDILAVIEGRDRAKYIKQGPSTRRILEENLLNNYSIKPYVTYLQLKYKMKKKNLFKKPVPIIPEGI